MRKNYLGPVVEFEELLEVDVLANSTFGDDIVNDSDIDNLSDFLA